METTMQTAAATEAIRSRVRDYVRAHRNREFVGNTSTVRSKPLATIAKELGLHREEVYDAMMGEGWYQGAMDAKAAQSTSETPAYKTLPRTMTTRSNWNPPGDDPEESTA
jgi:hypothetical protein